VRGTALRWLVVLAVGLTVLAVVLYFASTVDARPPEVLEVRLTQALSSDDRIGLRTTSIEVAFSENVDHAAAEAAFSVSPAITGAFTWSGSTMVFTPQDPLPLESEFEVNLATGVPDTVGNRMTQQTEPFAFRTVGAPRVVAVDPPDGASNVPLEAPLRVTFSTFMDTSTAEPAVSLEPETPLRFRWRQEVLEIVPLAPLLADRRYELAVDTDATDQAGTPLSRPHVSSFTTVASGLSVERVVPSDGSEGVAVRTPLAVVVDGAIDPDSLADVEFEVTPDVAGSLDVVDPPAATPPADATPRILAFLPSGPLPPTTTFTVRVGPGLRSIDGRILARELAWSFTTGAPQPTVANHIVFLSDRAGVSNLWAMNPDGSNERQISSELSSVIDYAVAPNGRSFVVGDGTRLVAQRSDGSDRRVLTEAGDVEYDPAFAPDGRSLVFGRADGVSGSALGIWQREGTTGAAERLDLADDEEEGPERSAPPGSVGPSVPLLRAPRYAPDGEALAWIDEGGFIVVLDLESEERTRVRFTALGPPTWLPDGRALVVSGLDAPRAGAPERVPERRFPVMPLDPRNARDGEAVTGLRLGRIGRDSTQVAFVPDADGAARVAAAADGRIGFVHLDSDAVGGSLWITNRSRSGVAPVRDETLRVARVSFAPEPGMLVIERVDAGRSAGIWILDERSGALTQLSEDGSQPRPLP
jgi:hypothetical protein